MKFVLAVVLVFTCLSSRAYTPADTITFWTIRYDKTIIISGNVTQILAPRYDLTVKDGALKDLVISFVYDTGQPTTSSVIVKEKNEILRTIESDPNIGGYFVVPVRELIGTHQPNVRYELDLYYSDNRGQKELKLGTIIFIFK
jgi:hypothetical protein